MYADYSQVQDFLTFLIEFISLVGFGGCVAHSVIKQHHQLSKIYREVPTASQAHVTEPINQVSQVMEVAPIEETLFSPFHEEIPIHTELRRSISVVEVPLVEVPVVEQELDVDNLPLRKARKLASLLKIKQKVNGKDQPISWLRAQIKKKLISHPEEMSKAIEIVKAA